MLNYKVARKSEEDNLSFKIGDNLIGANNFTIIAGPCAVESREQLGKVGNFLQESGIKFIRGGAYKPRTSPYSFQGLGKEGLAYLKEVKEKYNLAIVSELVSEENLSEFLEIVDIIQIGSRNMQNFELLKAVGRSQHPVLLKRGMMASIEEFISSAEYIRKEGNERIILCERGIRSFESYTRNTLDLSAVAVLKKYTNLPVFVDPSHGTGKSYLIEPMAKAALVSGADGLLIEVHPEPDKALCDGEQSLNFNEFKSLMSGLEKLLKIEEKSL